MITIESPQVAKKVVAHSVVGSNRLLHSHVPFTHVPCPAQTTPVELHDMRMCDSAANKRGDVD